MFIRHSISTLLLTTGLKYTYINFDSQPPSFICISHLIIKLTVQLETLKRRKKHRIFRFLRCIPNPCSTNPEEGITIFCFFFLSFIVFYLFFFVFLINTIMSNHECVPILSIFYIYHLYHHNHYDCNL